MLSIHSLGYNSVVIVFIFLDLLVVWSFVA